MNHSVCRQRLAHICRDPKLGHLRITARDMSQRARPPKQFAPLHPEKGKQSDAPKLKGVVFDVDGTLWYELLYASSCFVCPISLQSKLTPVFSSLDYLRIYQRPLFSSTTEEKWFLSTLPVFLLSIDESFWI